MNLVGVFLEIPAFHTIATKLGANLTVEGILTFCIIHRNVQRVHRSKLGKLSPEGPPFLPVCSREWCSQSGTCSAARFVLSLERVSCRGTWNFQDLRDTLKHHLRLLRSVMPSPASGLFPDTGHMISFEKMESEFMSAAAEGEAPQTREGGGEPRGIPLLDICDKKGAITGSHTHTRTHSLRPNHTDQNGPSQ